MRRPHPIKRLAWIIPFLLLLSLPSSLHAEDFDIDTSSPFVLADYSKTISLDFQSAALDDVLKIFSQQSGLNLVTSEDVAKKKVTVYLDKVPVEQALEQVLRANNLTYEIQQESNIYIVKPLPQPKIKLLTRVYYLKHATVSGSKIAKTLAVKNANDKVITEITDEEKKNGGLIPTLKGILTENGKIFEDPRTNSLVITDIASNFPVIERTINRLDVAVPQVLIEVEMLEVSKTTADLIGVKIGDTPLSFTGAQRDHVYPWNQNELLQKGYVFEEAEYRVGTIDASGLSAMLQFLRMQTDTKNLARPRILTLNNETAQIKISTDEAIGIKNIESSESGFVTVEAERTETGVLLTVTPQVNVDSNEIMMAICPRVIRAEAGGTFSGFTFKDPEEQSSQSVLKVKSGDTIIIGGLIRSDSTNLVTKVPILGDIPFIGAAFRHKDDTVIDRELVIFITPIIQDEKPETVTAVANFRPLVREQDVPQQNAQKREQDPQSLPEQKL